MLRARIKSTGEVLDVVALDGSGCQLSNFIWYNERELVFVTQPDWDGIRIDLASRFALGRDGTPYRVAEEAVKYANALVAELQKGGVQ